MCRGRYAPAGSGTCGKAIEAIRQEARAAWRAEARDDQTVITVRDPLFADNRPRMHPGASTRVARAGAARTVRGHPDCPPANKILWHGE